MTRAMRSVGRPVAVLLAGGALVFWLWGGGASGGRAALADTLADVRLVETSAVTPATDGVAEDGAADRQGDDLARATFAGGCFWCMEPPFDRVAGVRSTVSGFAGGHVEDPAYEEVASGGTGHREVVQVTYDPEEVSYARLLEVYWHNVDPVDGGGQFCDRGHPYSPAVFVHNGEQERLARASLERLRAALGGSGGRAPGSAGDAGNRSEAGRAAAVEILPLDAFYAAEDYHQDFYEKNPGRYDGYREGCGRDRRLREIWGEAAGH